MRWIVVRHGQSTWNAEGRFQGQARGVPLSDLGRRQARDAAAVVARLATLPVRLVSSDLERARDTASVIGARLGVPVELDADLREQAGGTMEGRLTRELVAEPTPPDKHLHEVRWGGGESIADVWRRVERFRDRVGDAAAPDAASVIGTVVVVAHGGTLQVLRAVLAGSSWRDVTWHDELANGEVLLIEAPAASPAPPRRPG